MLPRTVAEEALRALGARGTRGNATAAAQPRLKQQRDEQLEREARRAEVLQQAATQAPQDLLGQLQAHEIRIPVPWGHIAGKWWGRRDQRPLVALHGWGDNACSFERLATSLRGVPVLALDLPGHGFSSRVPRGLAPAACDRSVLLAALRHVQRALGLTALSLVGHSAGDALALHYAAAYPSEVDMYVSLDPLAPCPLDAESALRSSGAVLDELLEADELLDKAPPSTTRAELLEGLLITRGGSLNRHAAETLLQRAAQEGSEEGRFSVTLDPRVPAGRRLPLLSAEQTLAAARSVRCPTLAVLPQWRGPRALTADPELRGRVLDALRMTAKSLTTVAVDGTHHVHLNNPEVVMPALQEFINQNRRSDESVKVPSFST